jgi:WD40 repeat protein
MKTLTPRPSLPQGEREKYIYWGRISVLLLAFLLAVISPVYAQSGPPIILMANGDLWSWSEGDAVPQQLTHYGHNLDFDLSPDGATIAYDSAAKIAVDAIQRVGGMSGAMPSNIWLMDAATQQASRIADQPPDASFFSPPTPDKAWVRSTPVWSPDGTMVAWTDLSYPDDTNQLEIYDVASGTSRIVVSSLPAQGGVPVPMDFAWSQAGLIVHSVTMDSASNFNDALLVYDPQGNLLVNVPIPNRGDVFFNGYLPVMDGSAPAVAVLYNNGEWQEILLPGGPMQPLNGQLEMYAVAAPDTSLSLRPVSNSTGTFSWLIVQADGTQIGQVDVGTYLEWDKITLSPLGREVLFQPWDAEGSVYTNGLSIWFSSQTRQVPDAVREQYLEDFAWGETAWRVRHN